ncbi:hypothetical protein GJ744_006979 [Endocarpon pusillum]|uniref:Uncharacterized protein n=1 Tax=Endocarpon pusillum TaxID=364733 RepID=A0A8H7A414_9EURO|nr:hypothetical protein GJ744_006979 [Endocarpon pusillum]
MPHRSPAEQYQVPYGTTDSQQNMMNPNRFDHRALDGIGAQFKGHQPLQDGQKLMDHITRDAGQHHGHSVSLPRSAMAPGVVQDPRYSNSGPLTRFLLEASTQQPPFLVDRSNGQPSSRGGYWHPSSTSKK